jgi:hypothetical protein
VGRGKGCLKDQELLATASEGVDQAVEHPTHFFRVRDHHQGILFGNDPDPPRNFDLRLKFVVRSPGAVLQFLHP